MYVLATVLGFVTGYNVVEPIIRKVTNIYHGYTAKQHNKLYYSILRKQKVLSNRGVNYNYVDIKLNNYTKKLDLYNNYLDKVNHMYTIVQLFVGGLCLYYKSDKYGKTQNFTTKLVNVILASKNFNNYEKYELITHGYLLYIKKLLDMRRLYCFRQQNHNMVSINALSRLSGKNNDITNINSISDVETYINKEETNDDIDKDKLEELEDNDKLKNDIDNDKEELEDNEDELEENDFNKVEKDIELLIEELFDVLNIR